MLAPPIAQSQAAELPPPQFYSNGIKDTQSKVEQVNLGQLLLTSSALPGSEIECVWLAFGAAWNDLGPGEALPRGFSQILMWSANGHRSEGIHTELGSSCRGGSGAAWLTDESPLSEGRRGAAVSTPWNEVVRCGEREEENYHLLVIGYPAGEPPAQPTCSARPTEAAELVEMKEEREKHLRCYKVEEGKGEPEPEGCVNIMFVDPAAGEEIRYGGSWRPTWRNSSGRLDASKLRWEGEASGLLQCEAPACAAPATTTGSGQTQGLAHQQEILAK
jgi:hypothetical protein